MKRTLGLSVAWPVATVMLVLAVTGRHPYGFDTLLRWICCAAFAYSVFIASENKRVPLVWIFGVLAVLFNPILPVHLQRDTWQIIDWAATGLDAKAPGTWVFKPREQWHTFWNAGDTPCEIIEVISPGGFEDFFRELTTAWGNPEQMSALGAKYELDFDFESVPKLCERFGLTMSKIAN
jgi:hypothetical protein